MEAFTFLKFWKLQNNKQPSNEGEDSFIDLEISNYYSSSSPNNNNNNNNEISKKRVMPLDHHQQQHPQSPISLIKSATTSIFKIKPKPKTQLLTRDLSLKSSSSTSSPSSCVGPSKGIIISKYFNSSTSSSKFNNNNNNNNNKTDQCDAATLSSSMKYYYSGFWAAACRKLNKSRSATSAAVVCSNMRKGSIDYDSVVKSDGIQSAILHCKNSLNISNKESSSLSRCTSDSSSHEKMFARDSSVSTSSTQSEY